MDGVLVVIILGTVATIASAVAARWSSHVKARQGMTRHGRPLFAFWVTVATYMALFTMLRLAYWAGVHALAPVFYLQTVAGALTIISLSYIMVGIIIGRGAARLAAEATGALAVMILTIIFTTGLEGPVTDDWGVEFLPASLFARAAIGVVYVALPVAMSLLAVYVTWRASDGVFDRRLALVATSVSLMFVPNAIRYVVIVDGLMGVGLAAAMAVGAVLGAAAYRAR